MGDEFQGEMRWLRQVNWSDCLVANDRLHRGTAPSIHGSQEGPARPQHNRPRQTTVADQRFSLNRSGDGLITSATPKRQAESRRMSVALLTS